MRLFCAFAAVVVFCHIAAAATISGTAYEWNTLSPLEYTIVEIDTSPRQVMVAQDGRYSFGVPAGNYVLSAQYFEKNRLKYEAREEVEVKDDGNFNIDILMLPALDENELLFDDFNDIGVQFGQDEAAPKNDAALWIGAGGAIIVALGAAFLYTKKGEKKKHRPARRRPAKAQTDTAQKNEAVIAPQALPQKEEKVPEDLNGVIGILQRYGGRMTQKELREKSGIGEAKLSLMVAELENMGKIKKFKNGRGNIIILKE